MNILTLLFVTILFASQAWSLSPIPTFIEKPNIGFVDNYYDEARSIALSRMASDFDFQDLTPENVKELDKVHDTKREFGKMFGFHDWKVTGQKLIEKEFGRVLLFEGTYLNNKKEKVSFLEVYWANAQSSRQFLLTSEKSLLKLDQFQEYFIP